MSADAGSEATDCDMDTLLCDPAKQAAILQRLGQLDSSRVLSHLTLSGKAGGGEIPISSGSVPTLSGMFPAPSLTQRCGTNSHLFRPCCNHFLLGLLYRNHRCLKPPKPWQVVKLQLAMTLTTGRNIPNQRKERRRVAWARRPWQRRTTSIENPTYSAQVFWRKHPKNWRQRRLWPRCHKTAVEGHGNDHMRMTLRILYVFWPVGPQLGMAARGSNTCQQSHPDPPSCVQSSPQAGRVSTCSHSWQK